MGDGTEEGAHRRPDRGVRIRPLPSYMHDEFRRLCGELRRHAQSHLGTWKFARTSDPVPWVEREVAFWSSALKYISMLDYYGTKGHDTGRIRKARRRRARRDRDSGDGSPRA